MRDKIIIRETFAKLENDFRTTEFRGIDIVAEDGRELFTLHIEGNRLEIRGGAYCKHQGNLLADRFVIVPEAGNAIALEKVVDRMLDPVKEGGE